ncbi:MAG: hypothetical protein M0C28_17270 [Candidatus Moduliflexus flocculans]|nr:hypothetical protein [Candidatus Moduliflexus flocculans]
MKTSGVSKILCTDKTGTLTENTLQVTEIVAGAHPDLLHYASLTVAETEEKTEPFDIAIVAAQKSDPRQEAPSRSAWPRYRLIRTAAGTRCWSVKMRRP